jgi:small subunit ribosomal protein S21
MAASAYQGRFFCVSRPAAIVYLVQGIPLTLIGGGEQSMTKVYLRKGESPENLLKRFRKKVTRDRILSEAKKKRYFVSKSEQRRMAKRKAQRRERRRRWKAQRRQGRY